MNELKCLYFVIHNNNNKPTCLYRQDQYKRVKIIVGEMPDQDSDYTKTLIADNPSSYLISETIEAINKIDMRQETNKKKGRRLSLDDLESIKKCLLLEVPYSVLERRHCISKRTLQRINASI